MSDSKEAYEDENYRGGLPNYLRDKPTTPRPPPPISTKICAHKFVFLRQGYVDKEINRDQDERTYTDVFFCEHCLEYRRIEAGKRDMRK